MIETVLKDIKKGFLSDELAFAGKSPVVNEVIHVEVPVSNYGCISSV